MRKRRVRDVMTTAVHAVREDTPFKDVAATLAGHRISAVPVVTGDATVTGVVSEADLLPKQVRPEAAGWRVLFSPMHRRAAARVAADLMTSPAVTVETDTSVVLAARIMLRHDLKRLPVVDKFGKLVGVVSRADLVRAFVRSDEELREEIAREVFERALCAPVSPATAEVRVDDGVVTLTGRLERKSMVPDAVALTRQVLGVVDVVDQLTYDLDDTHPPAARPGAEGVPRGLW